VDTGHDWEAWVAVAGVLVSAVFALLARRDAKRAEWAADETRDLTERQAIAQERLESIRATGDLPPGAPDVAFELDYYGGSTWMLRNIGTREATGIRVRNGQAAIQDFPDGLSLGPLRSHRFMMIGTFGSPVPHELLVSADQLREPVPLQVPPQPRRR
jgi:hypothetical protein